MYSLILLLICLVILLCFSCVTSNGKLLTPQIGFVACFIPAVIYAMFYVDVWQISLSNGTLAAIIGGVTIFVVISIIVHEIAGKRNPVSRKAIEKIDVETWKLNLLIIFHLIVMFWILWEFNGLPGASLSEKIGYYRLTMSHTDEEINLPILLRCMRTFSIYSCYITGYLLLHSLILKHRAQRKLLIICLILGLVNGMLFGARGEAIQIIIGLIVQAYFIYRNTHGRLRIPFKKLLAVVIVILIIILSFQSIGVMMGREDEQLSYTIAVYLAAPLKNLDTFIRQGNFGTDFAHWQTLRPLLQKVGAIFNEPQLTGRLDNPFRSINGYFLGNVSTTFYAYLYDGGFVALIIYIVLMAIICQILFIKVERNNNVHCLNLSIVNYSYIYFAVLFSFFSNKFYEQVFSLTYIEAWITWLILSVFLYKVRVKRRY